MTVQAFCAPAFFHVPEHVGSFGDEVADLAASVGMDLDPEQRLVVDAMYAYDARHRLVAAEVGCAAPRQNVKTHVGKAAALADLVLFDEPQGLWTAHLRSTSDQSFLEMVELFENFDHLSRLVESISDSDGEKAIKLRRPAVGEPHPHLAFMTRSERGGRGLTGRKITYDEALFLKPPMLSAMIPILSAQSMTGAVQVRYLGSPGLLHSQSWRDVRDRGRAGDAARLAWIEWGAPFADCELEHCQHTVGTAGCALDREDLVRAANLAIDRRMDIDWVLGTERVSMSPEDYMRERLGWWQDPAHRSGAIDLTAWSDLGDEDPGQPLSGAVFAVATAPDRSWSAIVTAWRRDDGLAQVLLLDYRPGTAWVEERAESLLQTHGGRVYVTTGARGLVAGAEEPSDVLQAQAHNLLADTVETEGLRHGNEPAMTTSVRAARWRPRGDSRVLDRKGNTDISPLDAAGVALWALVNDRSTGGWMVGL